MPFSDYVPGFGESNLSVYYRNVLGVPIRKRVIVTVLTLLALILIIISSLLYGKYGKKLDENVISLSLPYVSMESSIDVSFNPCENFYDFTCNQWPKNELISHSESIYGKVTTFSLLQEFVDQKKDDIFVSSKVSTSFPRIVNDAIKFYGLCVNNVDNSIEASVNYLLEYFERAFGGWPVLNPDHWDGKNFDWIEVSAFLLQTLGLETIIGVHPVIDDYNSSRKLPYFSLPVWDDKLTLKDEISRGMLSSVISCLNYSNIQMTDIDDNIFKIQETEDMWFKHFKLKNSEIDERKITIRHLQEEISDFDWLNYVQLVTNNSLNEIGMPITKDDVVVIGHYGHLKKSISSFLSENITSYDLANLFGWFIIQKISFLVPGAYKKYTSRFLPFEDTEEIQESIKRNCYRLVKELYPCGLDYLYIHNSSHSGIEDGKVLVHYIKKAFQNLINSTEWLDDRTKKAALVKLNSMYSVIGFQDYLKDAEQLDNFYESLPAFSNILIQTYFQVTYFFRSVFFQEMKLMKFSRYTSPRPVTDVSAYYEPRQNMFTLPLAMYNLPFYHFRGPWYLNFGSLGSIIGHEIMHGFDSEGCKRDETGSFNNWWSNHSAEAYALQINCFENQYRVYAGAKIENDALITLNEDIADNEGLRIAFLAYQQWVRDNGKERSFVIGKKRYSPEQAFFIAFGSIWCSNEESNKVLSRDKHSSRRHRIVGPVSNSIDFSKAFKCPKDSTLNPITKCLVW